MTGEKNKVQIHIGKNNVPRQERQEEIRTLSAKLHPEYDKDLKEALVKIPKRERSKLYRDAVRMYLKLN